MIKIDKIKFTKEIKSIIKNLDDEISYYTNVDISWYDRYSDNSYIINDYLINKEEFVEKSDYIYLTSIVITDKYRNKHYGSLLQEKFLKDNKDKKIVVLTVSTSGYNLANKYFKLLKQIDDNHNIFINKN